MRRAIDKLIGSPLSKEIIAGRIKHGDTVRVDVDRDGGVVFEPAELGLAPNRDPQADETLSL